jgi:hypothetical protein
MWGGTLGASFCAYVNVQGRVMSTTNTTPGRGVGPMSQCYKHDPWARRWANVTVGIKPIAALEVGVLGAHVHIATRPLAPPT